MKSVTHYGRTSGLGRFTVKNDFGDIRKLNIFEIDVDYDLFNDGTLKLVKSPGHSPGPQVLLLDLPNRGRICLAADTGHQRDGFENIVPMPWDWSASGMTLTRQRIKQLERSGARFFLPCGSRARSGSNGRPRACRPPPSWRTVLPIVP